jgi:hypothetical protein
VDIRKFERKICHLTQEEIVQTGVSVTNMILVEKGICTEDELQNKFLKVMRQPDELNPAACPWHGDKWIDSTGRCTRLDKR